MKRRRKRPLGDAYLLPRPSLAPYGLGEAKTTCSPVGKAIKVCVTRPEKPGKAVNGPEDVCRLLRGAVDADRENLYAIHLDVRNRVLGIEHVARGALDWVGSTPREVFKSAVIGNAAAVIIAHNHPSGSSVPSQADVEFTQKLIAAGKLVGIPVRDHIIVGAEGCSGMRERMSSMGFGDPGKRRRR